MKKLPEVGEFDRRYGTLLKVQHVPPPPQEEDVDYIYESVCARVDVYTMNGVFLRHCVTFNEWGGSGTAVSSAIEEALMLSSTFGPGVEVRVTKVTDQTRMKPTRNALGDIEMEPRRYGSKVGVADTVEEVVWSSKQDE